MFHEYETKLLTEIRQKTCICDHPRAYNSDQPKFIQYLRRFNTRYIQSTIPDTGFLEDNFNLYLFCANPREVKPLIDEWYRRKELSSDFCLCKLRAYFKKVTGLYKKGGTYVTEHWRIFCYWESLLGYHPYIGLDRMWEDAMEWLHYKKPIGQNIGEDYYCELIYKKMRYVIDTWWTLPEDTLNATDWIATGQWLQGKAGTGGKTTVEIAHKVKRSKGMKAVAGVYYDDSDILLDMNKVRRESMHVMEKSEQGKSRPVVKCGDHSNRLMSYLSQWVERGFKNCPVSSLFMSSLQKEDYDLKMMHLMESSAVYKIPLDQGSFDNMQSKNSIEAIFRALRDGISEHTNGTDFRHYFNILYDSIFGRPPLVKIGGRETTWENGMPSGWRWTALLDTMLNICSFLVIVDLAEEEKGSRVVYDNLIAQGDDILFTTTNYSDAVRIIEWYSYIGYDVHPEKTYISRARAEFLRKSYESNIITGYRARSMLSILYRNPIKVPELVKPMRLYARISVWSLLIQRGADADKVGTLMLEDARQAGVDRDKALGFMLLPAAYGGAGIPHQCHLGNRLRTEWDGRYWRPSWLAEPNITSIRLGKWSSRLARYEIELRGSIRTAFEQNLLQTWGYTPQVLTKQVKLDWEEVDVRAQLQVFHECDPVPDPDSLWNIQGIAVQALPFVKQQIIEDQREAEYINPAYIDWLKQYKKRVSRAVYRRYLLGQVNIPAPATDLRSARFGAQVKKVCQHWCRRLLNTKNLTLSALESGLYALELYYLKQCDVLFKDLILAP